MVIAERDALCQQPHVRIAGRATGDWFALEVGPCRRKFRPNREAMQELHAKAKAQGGRSPWGCYLEMKEARYVTFDQYKAALGGKTVVGVDGKELPLRMEVRQEHVELAKAAFTKGRLHECKEDGAVVHLKGGSTAELTGVSSIRVSGAHPCL